MNALRVVKIANKLFMETCAKYGKTIHSFEMTEKEWERYSRKHPNADRNNHTIVPSKTEKSRKQFHSPLQKKE